MTSMPAILWPFYPMFTGFQPPYATIHRALGTPIQFIEAHDNRCEQTISGRQLRIFKADTSVDRLLLRRGSALCGPENPTVWNAAIAKYFKYQPHGQFKSVFWEKVLNCTVAGRRNGQAVVVESQNSCGSKRGADPFGARAHLR